MKYLQMLLMAVLLTGFVNAQSVPTELMESDQMSKNNWVTYLENADVKVEVKLSDCSFPSEGISQQFLLFRYTNLTTGQVDLEFNLDAYYNGKCSTCGSNEYMYDVSLQSGDVLEAECDLSNKPFLAVFSKFLRNNSSSQLSAIQLSNLTITK